jgi:hypothetical protein
MTTADGKFRTAVKSGTRQTLGRSTVIVRIPGQFPGKTFPAVLREQPNPFLPSLTQWVLEVRIDEFLPLQIEPPGGLGCEIVEATAEEHAALAAAGYELPRQFGRT